MDFEVIDHVPCDADGNIFHEDLLFVQDLLLRITR